MNKTTTDYAHDSLYGDNPSYACDHCHLRKIRCDKHKPQCVECIKRNIKCNYGIRAKRGPKVKSKIETKKQKIQNIVQKSNNQIQAMLFELKFNQKMAELWKSAFEKKQEISLYPPAFDPRTEEFIRAPMAAKIIIEEYNASLRYIFTTPNLATSLDFAEKIWQAIIDVNLPTLLQIFSEFETSLLVSIIDYLVTFILSLQIYQYNDISTHIAGIIQHIINIIIFTRDGTDDSLTPALTLQLLHSMPLFGTYYKMGNNIGAMVSNAMTMFSVYDRHKDETTILGKEIQARMYCRRIMACKTKQQKDDIRSYIQALNLDGAMTPNLQYHCNIHFAVRGLVDGDLSESEAGAQRAEYFINWHLDQLPLSVRPTLDGFYKTRLGVVFTEIALRRGEMELARKRLSVLLETFNGLSPIFKRIVWSHCYHVTCTNVGSLMTIEYMTALMNPPNLVVRAQLAMDDAQQDSSNSDQIGDSPEDNTLYDWLHDSDEVNRDVSGESSGIEEFVDMPSLSQLPAELFDIDAAYN
jgi:hypothetical protein